MENGYQMMTKMAKLNTRPRRILRVNRVTNKSLISGALYRAVITVRHIRVSDMNIDAQWVKMDEYCLSYFY